MRKSQWFLIGLVLAGLVVAEAVAAQSPPQRAPGVPMTPNVGDVQKNEPRSERERVLRERERLARDRSSPPEPNREIPMPKPVPSIIAPTR